MRISRVGRMTHLHLRSGGGRSAGPRALLVVLVVAVLATGCGGTPSSDRPADAQVAPPSPTATVADLTAAGITVVDDEAQAGTGRLLLTWVQAQRLAENLDWGVVGADLDALRPAEPGMVPLSYLIAGWLSAARTPASEMASSWMGLPTADIDWTMAPHVRFPMAVVSLFVADMARLIDEHLPRDTTGGARAQSGVMLAAFRPLAGEAASGSVGVIVAAADGPCSTVTTFLASAINGLFGALRLSVPASGGGFFSDVARVLATVWNTAVSYAQRVVQGLVDKITAPVFEAIRIGVGVLGVATIAISYLEDQKLTITVDPAQTGPDTYRFAVGPEADVRGLFVARPASLSGNWPPFLVDCAKTAGAELPELIAAGADTQWDVQFLATPVIEPGALATTVGNDLTARLDFVTGRESEEQAKGEAWWDGVVATATVPRKEVNDFLALGRDQILAAKALMLAQIPEPNLRIAAGAGLDLVVDPVVAKLESDIAQKVPGIFTLRGNSDVLFVQYHLPPEPTPSVSSPPIPSASPPSDEKAEFCARYRALLTWWQNPTEEELSQAWARYIVRSSVEMRAFAPPDLVTWVDVVIGAYDTYAEVDDPFNVPLAGPDAARLLDAALAMDAYCGVRRPEEFP
ncbi:MAG: hypothetical protein A2V85_16975 [Chloroflexi bacterium RBG_16_72_14]|nr:MAG: hypothetical protein A2V85_16975 [Chloroflexi bacterium RBG_16_72_14]